VFQVSPPAAASFWSSASAPRRGQGRRQLRAVQELRGGEGPALDAVDGGQGALFGVLLQEGPVGAPHVARPKRLHVGDLVRGMVKTIDGELGSVLGGVGEDGDKGERDFPHGHSG